MRILINIGVRRLVNTAARDLPNGDIIFDFGFDVHVADTSGYY